MRRNLLAAAVAFFRERFTDHELEYVGPTSGRAHGQIEHNLRNEQVAAEMKETVSFDLPVDEQGDIIVGEYAGPREPMDGVTQRPTDYEAKQDAATDLAYQQALQDPTAVIRRGDTDRGAPNGRPHSI